MSKPYNKKFNMNKCITNDLIITFPMSDEQIQAKKESIKRLKHTNENLYEDDYCSMLNEFEMIQYRIYGPSLFEKCFKEVNYEDLKSNTSLYIKYMIRERDFSYFIKFKSDIIQNGFENKKNTQILGKLNDDGSPILKVLTTVSPMHSKELLIDMKDNNTTEYIHDFPLGTTFDRLKLKLNKQIENWNLVEKFPFGSLVIPKFKEICHSVLKELFLIKRVETINKINSLPSDILIGFINSCFEDKTPVGKEILFELYKKFIVEDKKDDLEIESIFPLDKLLNSCFIRDDWFRFNYSESLAQHLFLPPFNDRFSINVYENYQLFTHKQVPHNLLDNILFNHCGGGGGDTKKSNILGEPSIVKKEKFIENFHLVTNNMFNDLSKIPKTCFFIGGIITACLTDSINDHSYNKSDIDICFAGDDDSNDIVEFIEAYFGPLNELQTNKTSTIHGHHLTISKYYPNRHVQINVHTHISLEDILLGVDIDASCFAFNGVDLFCLERAMHSINYGFNIACEFNFTIRGNVRYQKRLIKYLDRGFDIFYLSTSVINHFLKHTINIIKGDKDGFSPTFQQNGFALLYSAKLSDRVLKDLKKQSFSLPFDPSFGKSETDSFIQINYDSIYNGYSTPDCHRFVTTDSNEGEEEDSIQSILFQSRCREYPPFQRYSWEQYITNEILRSNILIDNQYYND